MVSIYQNQDSGQALVLSSDSETSSLIARLLDAEGYATVECVDPNAIDKCIAEPSPAVIVVDAAISSGDPLDLCLAIRQRPGCDFIPLLLLSTECEEADAARAYDRNVTTVIAKPVDEDVFKKHIRSLGDTGRTLKCVFSVGDGQVARITSSIGYASYPFLKDRPDILTWEDVLGVADAAMYEAKQHRNSWLGIEGLEWTDSGNELYRALKSDPGALAENGSVRAIESLEDVTRVYA